jgi:hypothetical protein
MQYPDASFGLTIRNQAMDWPRSASERSIGSWAAMHVEARRLGLFEPKQGCRFHSAHEQEERV